MKLFIRVMLGLAGWAVAGSLFWYKTDRIYTYAEPQEGQVGGVVMEAQQDYEQSMIYSHSHISRVGIYARSQVAELPVGQVMLAIKQDDQQLVMGSLDGSVIDNEGATSWRFNPPIAIDPDKPVILTVRVTDSLSGKIRLQKALTADTANGVFKIDGAAQTGSLALVIYDMYRPPLAYQGGVIVAYFSVLILFGIRVDSRRAMFLAGVALTIIYLAPAWVLGNFSVAAALTFVFSFSSMMTLLIYLPLPWPIALLGAQAFAFTTWWPLHLMSGRGRLMAVAALPFFVSLIINRRSMPPRLKRVALWSAVAFMLVAISLFGWRSPITWPRVPANFRDIYLDPNQTRDASKFDDQYLTLDMPTANPEAVTQNGGWHHFGSYIGVINLLLATVGILFYGRKYWLVALLGGLALAISDSPLTRILSPVTPLPPQYVIIVATFSLAFLAALGLKMLWSFLGKDRLATFLVFWVVLFALLDLMNVVSKTVQFNLL